MDLEEMEIQRDIILRGDKRLIELSDWVAKLQIDLLFKSHPVYDCNSSHSVKKNSREI